MNKKITHDKLFNRDFILLWQGSAFSTFGSVLYSIAIGYWVFEKTGSTGLMGLMSSIALFINMALNPISGAIIDRLNRRNVIVLSDLVRGFVFLVVGLLANRQWLSVPVVIATAVISGFCSSFLSPAASSLFADLLPPHELVRGQSIASGTDSLIRLVGQAVSGALILMFGVPLMILINGICYLLSAISELFITPIKSTNEATPINVSVIIGDLKAGARFALRAPGLSTMMIGAIIINLFGSGFNTLMIPYVLNRGMDMIQYGVIASMTSLGGLIGMMLISVFKIKEEHRYNVAMGSFIGSMLLTTMGIYLGSYHGLIGMFFLAQLFGSIGNALFNSAFILYTPQDKRGMIFGFLSSAAIGGVALSSLAYGFLGEFVSLTTLGMVGNMLAAVPFIFIIMDQKTRALFINHQNSDLNPEEA